MSSLAVTTAAPAWLHKAVDLLAANRSRRSRLALSRDATAVRIGRNDVWEIVAPSVSTKRFYAKFWSSAAFFQRELEGREIINAIAESNSWLMPAPLLFADAGSGAIVTEQLPGTHFDTILRGALRRFTSPTRRRTLHAESLKCLTLVLRFLQELHSYRPKSNHSFADIRPTAVIGRINQLALRIRKDRPISQRVRDLRQFPIELPHIPSSPEIADVLLYGDLSPANFIFDGERIGLFDFENLGVGPPCRDFSRLEFHLENIGAQWRYRAADSFVRLIPHGGSRDLRLLFRLHFTLLHLNLVISRAHARSSHRRLADAAEIRRATRQLRNCCHQIRSAGWLG